MKAVIVIDLNDTTLKEWDTDTSKCWAEVKVHTPINGGAHGIGCVYANDNVELKPMPERINPLKVDSDNLLDLGYMHGRNDLINQMEGEE